jgi:hypothetical protein
MSNPKRDEKKRTDAQASGTGAAEEAPGQLGVDDRGNITWTWKQDEALLADDTLGAAERVRALLDPKLGIDVEEEPGPSAHDPRNTKGLTQGYDPYRSGVLGKAEWKKKRDLRALSEWVEVKKKHGGKPPV